MPPSPSPKPSKKRRAPPPPPQQQQLQTNIPLSDNRQQTLPEQDVPPPPPYLPPTSSPRWTKKSTKRRAPPPPLEVQQELATDIPVADYRQQTLPEEDSSPPPPPPPPSSRGTKKSTKRRAPPPPPPLEVQQELATDIPVADYRQQTLPKEDSSSPPSPPPPSSSWTKKSTKRKAPPPPLPKPQQELATDIPNEEPLAIEQTNYDQGLPNQFTDQTSNLPYSEQTKIQHNKKKKGLLDKAKNLFSPKTKKPTRKREEQVIDDQFKYDWNAIGRDHKKQVPLNKPMIEKQMEFMKTLGITFGTYLGSDTYGHVWRVNIKKKGTVFKSVLSCKVLSLNTFDTNKMKLTTVTESVNTMFREIRILRKLIHPNIIKLEDVVEVPDSKTGFPYSSVCMLMEDTYGNLSHLIERPVSGLLTENECKEWFGQIAEAVRYLHHKNIVHMNIKPESIRFVIKHNKVFKLSDFCYAIDFGEGMSTFSNVRLMGKCMAPEVRGMAPLDSYDTKSADIWSLCVTLIVALIGVKTEPQIMLNDLRLREWMNITYMPYPPTPVLAELTILMSEIDPNDRPTIDEVCAHKWLNS